jgi:hypothetical protein
MKKNRISKQTLGWKLLGAKRSWMPKEKMELCLEGLRTGSQALLMIVMVVVFIIANFCSGVTYLV